MISYFELLQMIKDGEIPKKVRLHYALATREYRADYDVDTFSHYELCNKRDEDDNFRFYLSECFLDSDMFDEKIEIIEGSNKKIEKINYITSPAAIVDKINEIISVVNNMSKE